MSRRTAFLLGMAYGISLGMAAQGLLAYGDALAQARKRPAVKPVTLDVTRRRGTH